MKQLVKRYLKNLPKLKPVLVILALCSVINSAGLYAQNQYNQWAFGSNAGYDFTSFPGGPLASTPVMSTIQTAASWCNTSGNLWFYTQGTAIYNINPLLSCTGCLDGNPNNTSAMQGVLILPKLGGLPHEFIIFTVPDRGTINNGLVKDCYDANVGNVCGGTWMGFAPGTFGSFTTEALTAARHANGTDFWIIVKPVIFPVGTPGALIGSTHPTNPAGATNSSVYAYLYSSSGLSSTPVISNAGFASDIFGGVNFEQEIKCSPDGKLVAITNRISPTSGDIKLYSFDNATGQMQLLQTLPMPTGYSPWSISFSQNSKVLYATGLINVVDGEVLRQFDLSNLFCSLGTAAPFCDYFTTVPFSGSKYTRLQLNPDGRIFRTRRSSQYIDVINFPDIIGCSNIGYQAEAIQISTSAATSSHISLPNNIDAFTIQQQTSPSTTAWPKTTTNTVSFDKSTMVDLDQFGDVYSAGEFRQSTKFENLTITGMSSGSAYLAKYDNCSGLEWVAKAVPVTPNGTVSCTSMSVGTSSGFVMMTGHYNGQVTFSSGVTPALTSVCAASSTINGTGIYIAVYDFSGCLKHVLTIPNDPNYSHNSSHITQSRILVSSLPQNRVYVAVNETTTTTQNRVRIFAYQVNSSGVLSSIWIAPIRSSGSAVVNDIGSYRNTVAVTGTFDRDVFWNTSTTAFGSGASTISEAFVLTMNDVNNLSIPNIFASQTKDLYPTQVSTKSAGTGVTVFSSNDVVITGNYTVTTNNAFSTGLLLAANGSFTSAYAIRINATTPSSNWARYFQCDVNTKAADVTYAGMDLYFTGLWEGSNFYIQSTSFPTTVTNNPHMYLVKMRNDGTYNAPSCWRNHSYISNNATDYITPARIAANVNYVYASGAYSGTAQMENDIAGNSPLTSTVNTFNSFVWRYYTSGGLSLREAEEAGSAALPMNESLQLFPNPVQHTLHVVFDTETEASSRIEVYNTAGQLVHTEIASANSTQLHVADWPAGIYLLRVERNGRVFTEKFIRE